MTTILLCLGRYGDIINALPIAFRESQRGNRLTICVAKEFESLLDGITYADRVVWSGRYSEQAAAIQWLRAKFPGVKIITAQAYRHPTDKQWLTPSYQTESWRLAGRLEEFGMWPTVFDNRDALREFSLEEPFNLRDARPLILVGTHSVSSPLRQGIELLDAIRFEFGDTHNVVDLSKTKAERLYDLLGLFDRAACLVTADTAFLHLSRASRVPVVALISEGNVGSPVNWYGSIPPPNAVASFRYSTLKIAIGPVLDAVRGVVQPAENRCIIHVVDNHGDTVRHAKARITWETAAMCDPNLHSVYATQWGRAVGDRPFLRDILGSALATVTSDRDTVIWSNSDTIFAPGAFRKIADHVGMWGACSIRRVETDGRAGVHMGRDVFAFRADWLREHMAKIPDFVLGCCQFDLVLAALIRKACGVPTNKENLHDDIFPCEMPAGLIHHEPHESSWLGESQGNNWNKATAKAWCAINCPTLKL